MLKALSKLSTAAIAAAVLAAVAAAPGKAWTTQPGAWGPPGTRALVYPNTCNWGAGTLSYETVNVTKSPAYANADQTVYAWARILYWNGTAWRAIKWANGTEWNLAGSVLVRWNNTEGLYLGSVALSKGFYYSVQLQFGWWVNGVGWVASAVDSYDNDAYTTLFPSPYGGEYLNTGPASGTTYGYCYVN